MNESIIRNEWGEAQEFFERIISSNLNFNGSDQKRKRFPTRRAVLSENYANTRSAQ